MTEQPDFIYLECTQCGFDSVHRKEFSAPNPTCSPCASSTGHKFKMRERVCRESDVPVGFDARKVRPEPPSSRASHYS